MYLQAWKLVEKPKIYVKDVLGLQSKASADNSAEGRVKKKALLVSLSTRGGGGLSKAYGVFYGLKMGQNKASNGLKMETQKMLICIEKVQAY